jgi:hypothetical protein
MALHTDLPVYKLAYDLLSLAADLTRNMPRDFKNSLGQRIRDECVAMIVLIGRVNATREIPRRVPHLTELLERLEVAQLLLRLSHDKKFIAPKQWAHAVQLIEAIGRQAGGWRRSSAAASPVA